MLKLLQTLRHALLYFTSVRIEMSCNFPAKSHVTYQGGGPLAISGTVPMVVGLFLLAIFPIDRVSVAYAASI